MKKIIYKSHWGGRISKSRQPGKHRETGPVQVVKAIMSSKSKLREISWVLYFSLLFEVTNMLIKNKYYNI